MTILKPQGKLTLRAKHFVGSAFKDFQLMERSLTSYTVLRITPPPSGFFLPKNVGGIWGYPSPLSRKSATLAPEKIVLH